MLLDELIDKILECSAISNSVLVSSWNKSGWGDRTLFFLLGDGKEQ